MLCYELVKRRGTKDNWYILIYRKAMSYFWLILAHMFVKETLCMFVEVNRKCVHIDYRGKDFGLEDHSCNKNELCNKTFHISYVLMPPYSEYPLQTMLKKCCGECMKAATIHTFANLTEVSPTNINRSDFVGLFLGSSQAHTLYGYYFIPVVYAPNAFYITSKGESIILTMINACLLLYPLILICALMAVMAGFLVWILETWVNKDEFPRPFLHGWLEGCWWSFVSMTTVGYGDKIPRTAPARVFAFIWILLGVAMFSMFTAMLTTEVMKANFPDVPEISKSNVGILKYREYDASFVARHGGIVTETNGTDFHTDVFQLIRKLRLDEIDGLLLDKYTLRLVNALLSDISKETKYAYLKEDIDFFLTNTIRTEKIYGGELLSFGILVKSYTVYMYFRDVIKDNRIPLETEISLQMNGKLYGKKKSDKINLFSTSNPYFQDAVKVMMGILASMFVFGFFYELRRRKYEVHAGYPFLIAPTYDSDIGRRLANNAFEPCIQLTTK